MELLVQKYGGSILQTPEQIHTVADHIIATKAQVPNLVVVVSAMKGTTDQLLHLARAIASTPNPRELDMLLTAGERITMSLLAIALTQRGCLARSLTGSQCGIVTDETHTDASIVEIRGDRIREALKRGEVVVVAGFQGVSREREVTTLGRGGSDITAVALAAFLGASCCELYKDVEGLYETDPHLEKEAKILSSCDYETAERLARNGAKVLHPSAIILAKQHNLPLHILSLHGRNSGTLISDPHIDHHHNPVKPKQRGVR
ncbi:MAG TPA: aspartate kinase [Bdellovibrionota bacterium]|nr:aspartate kinase [Bdellovibrionota bacterium]